MIWIIILSIISATLYRAGGFSREEKHWIPVFMRHSWVRDWLCPACVLGSLVILHPYILFTKGWLLVPTYAIIGASLTTYWDWIYNNWDNFYLSGFMSGLSLFPLAFCGLSIWLILLRAVILAIIWGETNRICNKYHVPHSDFVEEYTRGFSLVATSLLV